jgi:ribonuclease E
VADAGGPVEHPEEGEAEQPKRRRRRRSKAAGQTAEAEVEPDSSPMVERPTDEEPPITATEPAAEEKPKRRRSKKPKAGSADAAPAEATDGSAAGPSKGAKAISIVEGTDAALESEPVSAANNDAEADGQSSQQRRGWWQRTIANRL